MKEEDSTVEIPTYSLTTIGDSINGWKLRGRSRAIFLDRQAAAEHIETFENAWYDPTQFEHAVPGTLKTEITEHVLCVSRHLLHQLFREYIDEHQKLAVQIG